MIYLYSQDYRRLDKEKVGVCDGFWLRYNNKNFLFKYNVTNTRTDCGERIYSILGKELGVNVVQTAMAKCYTQKNKSDGIIVKDFVRGAQKSHSFNTIFQQFSDPRNFDIYDLGKTYCIKNIIKTIKNYAKENNLEFNETLAKEHLVKQAIIDYFLCQKDRHMNNIELLTDGKSVKIAPVFDNGMCLGFGVSPEKVVDKMADINLTMKPNAYISLLGGSWNNQANEIALFCKKNRKIKNFVQKIQQIDLDKVFEQLDAESGSALSPEVKGLCKHIFEIQKDNVQQALESINNMVK